MCSRLLVAHGFTATGIATTRSEPSEAEFSATIGVLPAARPVTVPLASTVATESLSDSQRAAVPPAAANDAVAPVATVAGVATVRVVLPMGLDDRKYQGRLAIAAG